MEVKGVDNMPVSSKFLLPKERQQTTSLISGSVLYLTAAQQLKISLVCYLTSPSETLSRSLSLVLYPPTHTSPHRPARRSGTWDTTIPYGFSKGSYMPSLKLTGLAFAPNEIEDILGQRAAHGHYEKFNTVPHT